MSFKCVVIACLLGFTAVACVEDSVDVDETSDPKDECALCGDEKADAFFIKRESYLAYGVIKLANTASFETLDDDVRLDKRAARGIVDKRPFEFVEQIDTVPYVGKRAFTKLAQYAKDKGFVPYCGDGELQVLLEKCDDGNNVDGDGCSSTCTGEQVNPGPANDVAFFKAHPDLIQGKDINVSMVNADSFYLRSRRVEDSRYPERIKSLLTRADGIKANEDRDGKVSFDELVLLSTEPFFSSLFAEEKAALNDVWALYEVSTKPVINVEYDGPPVNHSVPFTTRIVRPGPRTVASSMSIRTLERSSYRELSQRLQQLPGCNADNDPNTISIADLDKAKADYEQVLTPSEYSDLDRIKAIFIDNAEPSEGGDFVVTFNTFPSPKTTSGDLAAFDDYQFRYNTLLRVDYDAHDDKGWTTGNIIDVNMKSEYSMWTQLLYKGSSNVVCSYSCSKPFNHANISFIRLSGQSAEAGRQTGVMLMEHWVGGQRIYNRVMDFKETYNHANGVDKYHNEFATARPELADGTPLSLRKNGTQTYYRGRYKKYTYQRFKLVEVQTAFNKNLQKFFPNYWDTLSYYIKPGRYNDFDGVVLDVHQSRVMIAYFDGCEKAFYYNQFDIKTEPCENSGRWLDIDLLNRNPVLRIWRGSSFQSKRKFYRDGNEAYIGIDKSYYVIK